MRLLLKLTLNRVTGMEV